MFRAEAQRLLGKDAVALEVKGDLQYAAKASDINPLWPDDAVGVFDPDSGKVTVFTDTADVNALAGVLLHEIGVHQGLRGLIGETGFE